MAMGLDRPRLVIFDVDGTLHDVQRWWPDLIREGLVEFSRRTGLVLDRPDDRAALAVVGEKGAGVWSPFLPDAAKDRWSELRALVLPMEVDKLRSGRDYLFPGIRDLLAELRRLGVTTALASNCGADYMAAMKEGQGLRALTDHQFCLASDGIQTKADMIRRIMDLTGASTDATVMVGDRENDQAAAREHGVPFVWRVSPVCRIDDADAVWNGEARHLLALLRLSDGSAIS